MVQDYVGFYGWIVWLGVWVLDKVVIAHVAVSVEILVGCLFLLPQVIPEIIGWTQLFRLNPSKSGIHAQKISSTASRHKLKERQGKETRQTVNSLLLSKTGKKMNRKEIHVQMENEGRVQTWWMKEKTLLLSHAGPSVQWPQKFE